MEYKAIQELNASGQATNMPPRRLVQAAHQFEGQLMKELLKPMAGGDALTGADDASGDDSGGALSEFASESLGQSLSEAGGLGIAHRIILELSHSNNQQGPEK